MVGQGFEKARLEGAEHPGEQRIRRVVRGAYPPLDILPDPRLAFYNPLEPEAFGFSETPAISFLILGVLQARGDVIEKDCERPDAGIVKALRLGDQDINRFCSGEVKTFPRMEPVNK